ncbi:MAG: hypothetical protein O2962_08165 [Cyanobacteria bacterium]|nr:hypothetical protein [Cyanobacteriota bacterium]
MPNTGASETAGRCQVEQATTAGNINPVNSLDPSTDRKQLRANPIQTYTWMDLINNALKIDTSKVVQLDKADIIKRFIETDYPELQDTEDPTKLKTVASMIIALNGQRESIRQAQPLQLTAGQATTLRGGVLSAAQTKFEDSVIRQEFIDFINANAKAEGWNTIDIDKLDPELRAAMLPKEKTNQATAVEQVSGYIKSKPNSEIHQMIQEGEKKAYTALGQILQEANLTLSTAVTIDELINAHGFKDVKQHFKDVFLMLPYFLATRGWFPNNPEQIQLLQDDYINNTTEEVSNIWQALKVLKSIKPELELGIVYNLQGNAVKSNTKSSLSIFHTKNGPNSFDEVIVDFNGEDMTFYNTKVDQKTMKLGKFMSFHFDDQTSLWTPIAHDKASFTLGNDINTALRSIYSPEDIDKLFTKHLSSPQPKDKETNLEFLRAFIINLQTITGLDTQELARQTGCDINHITNLRTKYLSQHQATHYENEITFELLMLSKIWPEIDGKLINATKEPANADGSVENFPYYKAEQVSKTPSSKAELTEQIKRHMLSKYPDEAAFRAYLKKSGRPSYSSIITNLAQELDSTVEEIYQTLEIPEGASIVQFYDDARARFSSNDAIYGYSNATNYNYCFNQLREKPENLRAKYLLDLVYPDNKYLIRASTLSDDTVDPTTVDGQTGAWIELDHNTCRFFTQGTKSTFDYRLVFNGHEWVSKLS